MSPNPIVGKRPKRSRTWASVCVRLFGTERTQTKSADDER